MTTATVLVNKSLAEVVGQAVLWGVPAEKAERAALRSGTVTTRDGRVVNFTRSRRVQGRFHISLNEPA